MQKNLVKMGFEPRTYAMTSRALTLRPQRPLRTMKTYSITLIILLFSFEELRLVFAWRLQPETLLTKPGRNEVKLVYICDGFDVILCYLERKGRQTKHPRREADRRCDISNLKCLTINDEEDVRVAATTDIATDSTHNSTHAVWRKYHLSSQRCVWVAILAQRRAAVTHNIEPDEDNMKEHC